MDDGDYDTSMNRSSSTDAFCRRCHIKVGKFFNSWHKVTGTYYLPTLLGSYTVSLYEHGHQRPASGSELSGCIIQPLSCPTPRCAYTLGFRVVQAPADKQQAFGGRELFKLPRIDLKCEDPIKRHYVPVEPQVVDAAPLAVDVSPTPGPAVNIKMEVESRPPPMSGPRHHFPHHDHQRHYQTPIHQVEAPRHSLPPPLPAAAARSPPAPLSSTALQKSPSNPPAPSPVGVKPAQHVHSHVDSSPNMATRTREYQPKTSSRPHSHSPAEPHLSAPTYPRPSQDVQLDAIERLQTQISQNSSTLVVHSRDMRQHQEAMQHQEASLRHEFQTQFNHQTNEIRRVDEAVERLHHEMMGLRDAVDDLTRELRHGGGPVQSVSAQDSALELMAQQVAVISHRTNEIDTLKITIEIMKNKIQRLEDAAAAAPVQPIARPYPSPREPPVRSLSSQAVGHYQSQPPMPHSQPTVPSTAQPQRTQSYHSHRSPSVAATPEMPHRAEPPQLQSWASVNAGTKRGSLDSPRESMTAPSSPKRLKLAPIEPRTYDSPAANGPSTYEYADSDSDAARVQSHSHTLPSSTQPFAPRPMAESTQSSQHSHGAFVAYNTQDAPSDESWRPESQRMAEVRTPRGRGRGGGGPGSRGGRARKSLATQVHQISTPEWEREGWQSTPQASPDGFYVVQRPSRGIVRRGGGGGGGSPRGGRPSSSQGRAMSLGLQGVTVGIGLPADPYAHTKKTRTKPIRNADGVLIRKDGRPDMRSQSSAANLRKVHAKREDGSLGRSPEPTPSNIGSSAVAETPSPPHDGSGARDSDVSMEKKHNEVLNKMFPNGLEKSRKEHDSARKVFEDGQDHTAHPRTQNHHSQQVHEADSRDARQSKHEKASTESVDDQDVDMDRPEDHADDEGQTPGGQTDNSGQDSQYHDAANEDEQQQRAPPQQPLESAQSSNTTATKED